MPQTLAETLQAVLPHLSATLADPERVARMQNLAQALPPVALGGFEARLGPGPEAVDFLQCFVAADGIPLVLAQHIETTALRHQPAWSRLAEFCRKWADEAHLFHRTIKDIWLEFDLDGGPGEAAPIPSVFLSLLPAVSGEPFEAVQSALPMLLEGQPPSALLDNLARCFRACPEGASVSHVGAMLSRSAGLLRVNVQRLRRNQIVPYLRAVGWPGGAAEIEELAALLFELVEHVTLCLDMGPQTHARLGLECTSRPLIDRSRLLTPLLDELVQHGLCTQEKRAALLDWAGTTGPNATLSDWPEYLVAHSLVAAPERFTALGRRLSHIKLVYQPGRPVQAKAYVGFGHVWVQAAPMQDPRGPLAQMVDPASGFARAEQVRPFKFPQDHGPHFEYAIEWWYYSGNLRTAAGRRFGYQLTFFRRANRPPADGAGPEDLPPQNFFAHCAIADIERRQHLGVERVEPGVPGFAGATGQPYHVWVENWSIESLNEDGSKVRLRTAFPSTATVEQLGSGRGDLVALDLVLASVKPATLQGTAGLHQKSEERGNASYYVSYTRMLTEGWLVLNGDAFQVTGLSWMDHEWGTTDLGPNGAGWDWFSIQLEDQRDLMYAQLRNRDGSPSRLSSGNLVEADGTVFAFTNDQVKLTVLNTWRSENSLARYPARWRLEMPSARLDLTVKPFFQEQEMRVSGFYWEGAVQVEGTSDGRAIAGSGYVELTGYPPQLNRTRPATIGARTR